MQLNFRTYEAEILAGLQNDKPRLLDARENVCYYNGDFDEYRSNFAPDITTRSALILQKIVKTLTSNLYRTPPTRTIQGNEEATAFLEGVYRDNHMFAKWQQADRLSTVAEVAAFQVAGTSDPRKPIKIHLWDASQFAVFLDPDDQTQPLAVVTLDSYDASRRYTLYTKDTIAVYLTDKLGPFQVTGGTAPKRVSLQPNPYGVLPFSFAHFEFPTMSFWSGSPGCQLKEVNEYINWRLSESADNLRYLGKPLGVAEGMPADWTPKRDIKPGDFIPLPLQEVSAIGDATKPSLYYLEANAGFSQAEWDDLQNYVDMTLECHGIPPAAIRLVQNHARSGISIMAEQVPLLLFAKNRQQPYAAYEERLAKLVFRVASAHLSANGINVSPLDKAADDINLTLKWGELFTELPGPERDRADGWLLENRMISKKMLVKNRYGYDDEQASKYLQQVKADLEEEQALGLDGVPPQKTAPPVVATDLQSFQNTVEANQEAQA